MDGHLHDNGRQRLTAGLQGLLSRQRSSIGREGAMSRIDEADAEASSTADFDARDLNRMLLPIRDEPFYIPGSNQRPQAAPYLEHSQSFPGTSLNGTFARGFGTNVEPTHDYFTTSESGYQSLSVTSGIHDAQYASQRQGGDYSNFPPGICNDEAHNPSPSHTRSVVSEPHGSTLTSNATPRTGRTRAKTAVAPCPKCGKIMKNPSDRHKHILQHEKPNRCHEPGCTRHDGFATQNDLQRHRASVHKRMPLVGRQEGYICCLCPPQPNTKPKFWPRKDNFKAHVVRKHAPIDPNLVIDRSATKRPDDAMTMDSGFVSNPSQIDPQEHFYRQDMLNPIAPSDPNENLHQGEYFGGVGAYTQNDSLAGIGGVVGPLSDLPTSIAMTDSMYSGSTNALGVLSTAALAMGHMSSPADSVMPTPDRQCGPMPALQVTRDTYSFPQQIEIGEAQWARLSTGNAVQTTNSPTNEVHLLMDADGNYPCQDCGKVKKRECDLRKHRKRHSRPYGCTFTDCSKRFGSRNDWKRHESSQHFVQDMWKCTLLRPDGNYCGITQPDRDSMRMHLLQYHFDIDRTRHEDICNDLRLGNNGHHRFWCGFCVRAIAPESMTNALESRFKHIGDHYDKDECNVDDWVCVKLHKKLGSLTDNDRKILKQWSRTGRWPEDKSFAAQSAMKMNDGLYPGPGEKYHKNSTQFSGGLSVQAQHGSDGNRQRISQDVDMDADAVSDDDTYD